MSNTQLYSMCKKSTHTNILAQVFDNVLLKLKSNIRKTACSLSHWDQAKLKKTKKGRPIKYRISFSERTRPFLGL